MRDITQSRRVCGGRVFYLLNMIQQKSATFLGHYVKQPSAKRF